MPYEEQKYFSANDTRKIAIYSRKSKFTGKGESIENQIELCREEGRHSARQEGVTLTDDDFLVFEDEGYSGKNLDRPSFQDMMKQARAHKIKVIICYRLDRISRNTGDFAALIEELQSLKVAFISMRDKFDTTTPTGKAMMMIVSVFSQLERETIAERIRDNMLALAKTGRWLGGQQPTGYTSKAVENFKEDGKARKLYKLDQVPEEIEFVKLIFRLFLEMDSFIKVMTYLNEKGIRTKNGREFTRFAVKNILENPVYMIADQAAYDYFVAQQIEVFAEESAFDGVHGIMAYNRTQQTSGKSNEYRDMADWIIAVGKHEGVIAGHDWVKARKMIQANTRPATEGKKQKTRSNVALLSGLITCGHCGDFMRPKLSSRISKEYGEYIYDYLCETKEKSRKQDCDCPRALGNTLDRLVCEEVKKLSEDGSVFLKELERAKQQIKGTSEDQEKQLAVLRKQVKEHETQISQFLRLIGLGDESIALDYASKEIEALHNQIQAKKQQIAELEEIANSSALSDDEFDLLRDLLVSFARSFETMSIEQRRAALRSFVYKVVWDGTNASIYFFGAEGQISELPFEKETQSATSGEEKAVMDELQMKSSCISAIKKRPRRMSP